MKVYKNDSKQTKLCSYDTLWQVIVLNAVLLASVTSCASIVISPFIPNNTDQLLFANIDALSVDNPTLDNEARKWYFGPYYSIIPNLQTSTGFYESNGQLLAAHIMVGNDSSKGTVIMIHGYNGSPLYTHYQYLTQQSIAEGYRVILLDLPGHAFSGGERGTIDNFSHYGEMIIDFLAYTEGSLGNNIMLVGFSTGAVAIYEAYILNEQAMNLVHSVILISPFSDLRYSSWFLTGAIVMKRAVYVQDKNEPLAFSQVPTSWAQSLKAWKRAARKYPIIPKKEILLVFGDKDKIIKYRSSVSYYVKHAPNAEIVIYEGQNHTLSNKGHKQVRTDIWNWMLPKLELHSR